MVQLKDALCLVFTPGRRWQPPYLPFKRRTVGNTRMLATVETSWSKVRCSAAACAATACCRRPPLSARWNVPKGARNGPCGGSTEEHCYVDETRPCIWYKIYDRAFKMGRAGNAAGSAAAAGLG